jgi:hypothetical protein
MSLAGMPNEEKHKTKKSDSQWLGRIQTGRIAPVVFCIFNRPDKTAKVFEAIRVAKPEVLLVVADGPRAGKPGEAESCRRTKDLVLSGIDWDTRVLTNFSETNLGCRKRISSGLTWAFEQVEEAIILEDDCLPDPTCFRYCTELLEYYRHDTRVGLIGSNNFQPQPMPLETSYYFSKYGHIWGWASWRRAWKLYDLEMTLWPELRDSGWLEGMFPRPEHSLYWRQIFDRVWRGEIDTWDYQLAFSLWSQNMISIVPRANLVSNIGAGQDATHTQKVDPRAHALPTVPMSFPLSHPKHKAIHHKADLYSQMTHYGEAWPPPPPKSYTIPARLGRMGRKLRRHIVAPFRKSGAAKPYG